MNTRNQNLENGQDQRSSYPISVRSSVGRRAVPCGRPYAALAGFLGLLLAASSANAKPENFPNFALGGKARGEAAITLLADRLPEVAAFYGKDANEMRAIFRRDHTLWVNEEGLLNYICETEALQEQAQVSGGDAPLAEASLSVDQAFLLHSRPSATKVIYLDFKGHVTSGTSWNTSRTGGKDFTTPPYDTDGVPSTFSATELTNIQYIWQRVAEDYAPFNVDVTTEDPGLEALRKTSSSDVSYGVRVCIGGSSLDWYGSSAGGVAYVGSFNWNSDTPCFVFKAQLGNGNEKYTADAASHEAGHTLGLHHDGITGGTAYYQGAGNWAPIMGIGYYKAITQWSKGEYPLANNKEDDLAVMQNYGITYDSDDHSNWMASATPLYGTNISASGVIERATDVDVFTFQTGQGNVAFTLSPAPRGADLDILVALYDGSGRLLTSSNPTSLGATLSTALPTGTYYLYVEGVGAGNLSTGYSDYASLGRYTLTGTVVPLESLAPPVPVASATPTTGAAPLTVNFSSVGSYDTDSPIVTYDWEFGDGNTSTDPNPSHVYSSSGTFQALLIVTDSDGLSTTSVLTITVTPAANQLPVAVASASLTMGSAPLAVNFTNSGSYDPDGIITSYSWAFGDGTTSTAANPSHTFSVVGSYNVTLTVTDDQGGSSSTMLVITVQQDANKVFYVGNIAMSLVPSPAGNAARAEVSVVDTIGAPLPNVIVSVKWAGLVAGTATGSTDANGKVVFTSKASKKTGTFGLTALSASASGYTYDASRNVETTDSIANK